jgi:membrane-anchored protein YejM (alkaline phosphatase superfamily)
MAQQFLNQLDVSVSSLGFIFIKTDYLAYFLLSHFKICTSRPQFEISLK